MTAPRAGQDFDHPDVVIQPGGPMLLRGATSVQDASGTVHRVDRPIVALCRCDKSSRLPWCDGTHKLIPTATRSTRTRRTTHTTPESEETDR